MIILMGPSASGKTSIGRILEKMYNIEKVVTYTTRDKRYQEIDGIDYHFISKEEFLKLKENNFFFETIEYNNNFYGTSIESLSKNKYMILDIEGYKSYLDKGIDITAFFLKASKASRINRMNLRRDSDENIISRLKLDDSRFDERKLDNHVYIINTDEASLDVIAKEIYDIYTK